MGIELKDLDVLVAGQVLTSRTETVEEYLRPRVRRLGVIGIAGAFHRDARARCSEYRNGEKVAEWPLPSVFVRNRKSALGMLLLVAVFLCYLWTIWRCALRLRGRFGLFLGVSCFSAFVGACLKKTGKVRHLVYYSIDYYPRPPRLGFDRMAVWLFRCLDRFCVREADVVWHISSRIAEARERLGGLACGRYRHLEVPLCYRESLMRSLPLDEIDRWSVGFVGTLTETQGLQLLVEAAPALVRRFPEMKLHIIGRGPYAETLETLVRGSGCADRFVLHGFIPDEDTMLNVAARFAVAVALWPPTEYNNILYADPGKPKLYMCLGVPCVIACGPDIARRIQEGGGGMGIQYDKEQLVEAISRIVGQDAGLAGYREKAFALGREFASEKILGPALDKTLRQLRD